MQKILTFIAEAKAELLKVNWPSRKDLINYTVAVVAVSLLVALFLGALDYLFSWLTQTFLLS